MIEKNIKMNKKRGIFGLNTIVKKDAPTSVILMEQGDDGK